MKYNYGKINAELMQQVSKGNGEIRLADCPELQKLIKYHLSHFDNEIQNYVDDLSSDVNQYKNNLNDIANQKYHEIIKTGNIWKTSLQNTVAKQYSDKEVQNMIHTGVRKKVLDAIGGSEPVIDHYLASVSDNTRRIDTLNQKAKALSKDLDKANTKINQTNHKFWYGIFGALIIGVCFSYLFL